MLPTPRLRDLLRSRHVIATMVVALAAACAGPSTTIDQTWTSPQARTQPPLQKVVTIFVSDNVTMRHSGEDRLALELTARGVEATPGYVIFRNGASNIRDLDAMKQRLRQLGYDGVVVMRIVDREQQIESVPATFDSYWGYWGPGYWGPGYWGGTSWPGYLYTETVYRLETAAYSLRDGQLLWSAVTSTVDPSNPNQLLAETTELVATRLTGVPLDEG